MAHRDESMRRNIVSVLVPTGLKSTPLEIDEEDYKVIRDILNLNESWQFVEGRQPDDDPNHPTNSGYQKICFDAGGRGYIRIKDGDDQRRICHLNWGFWGGWGCVQSYKWNCSKLGLTGLESLSLDCRKLTPFPEFIGNWNNLRELSLTFSNLLSHFPFDLGKLPHLKVLKLNGSTIRELPQSIGLLLNLEELQLSVMRNLQSLPSEMQRLPKLKVLRLHNVSSSFSLPEGFLVKLTNLETFSANHMEVDNVLQNIVHLAGLKILNLHHSKFDVLPDTIGNMCALEALNAMNATLSSLPDSIGNLRNLKQIDLRYCRNVESLPFTIGNLVNLKNLALSRTGISSLPESIGNLVNLKNLALSGTGISSLPESIGNLVNLETLDLSGTGISSLPESIGTLNNLKHLYLSKCNISSLPFAIGNLVQLRTLHLSESTIEAFPDSIGNLVNLTNLDLCHTRKLVTLPEEFKNLAGLETLNLANSGLADRSLPTVISNLKNLRIMILPVGYLDLDADGPNPREDSLLEILEGCPKLGCIGQQLGVFGSCPCGNAACFCQSQKIRVGTRSKKFDCHKKLPHSLKAVMYSLVRNKIRSKIFFPSNSSPIMSYPPLSLWPLILERVENAAKFEYYFRRQTNLCRRFGEIDSNCLPQADEIFQLLVDHRETILSHILSHH